MKTILKYPLAITDRQTITTKACAKFLSVQVQNDTPCLWLLVETDMPDEQIRLRIHGTGHEVYESENLDCFLGTIQLNDGQLVLHVFKEK